MILYFSQIDRKKPLSDFLKEYISFKDNNLDSILFFQIGEFYETFFEDAKVLSDLTGIILTSRKAKGIGDIQEAGFNKSQLDFYLKKLLSENYKVCLLEEFKDENNKTFRKLTRKYTKGTIIENEFLESTENNYLLAVFNKKDKCYTAYADVSTGQFYKTSGSFDQILLEIVKISPNEILIANSQQKEFETIISKYNCTILDESYFKDTEIEDVIYNYCKYTQKDYIAKLDSIINYKPEIYLRMDEITRRNLELTRTKRFLKKKGSLLWFLNYAKTPMGIRLLKKYLDEPLLDIEQIILRQDAVEELISHKKILNEFEKIFEEFGDLSRMCAKISNSTIFPKDLFQIVRSSQGLEKLYELTKKLNSKLLQVNEKKIKRIIQFSNDIKKAISENASNELKSGGIIKEGYSANLDYLKEKLENVYKSIKDYTKAQKRKLQIENLKIDYSRVVGYYMEIPLSKEKILPKGIYLRKQSLTNCARYTTPELKEYEENIFNLKFQINELEYALYCEIRAYAREFVGIIRDFANEIARIDVLVSFARCALLNNLVRPKFNSSKIYIKDGFHPSLIKLNNDIVKNDTILENNSMIILTGANMSGKSTYLKYNAIICLLSQIGSYIPAKSADITIIDKIFIRQGATDDIINNNSSFMVEMNDLKTILDNATSSSFILLDEPAKSTSAKEGGAIAKAYCEYIVNHLKAKTIVATHNLELTKLEKEYPSNIFNYVIGTTDNNIFNRKIKRGVMNTSLAINTAILADLPQEIIKQAKEYTISI